MIKKIVFAVLIVSLSIPAFAYNELPGKGVTVKPARGPWSTGYFHALIIEKGLKELGYNVQRTKELPVALFFKTVNMGDIDYWPNTWLPNQGDYLRKSKFASAIGYVVKKQALQGYAIDKKHAESLNITSLEDFKRPEVQKAFDKDGDGKADLTGAPHGWKAGKTINQHIKEYGLSKHVKQISASYEAAMAANIAAFKSGEPIFYYTWTPCWTTYKLVPGKDVVWLNVPFNISQTESKDDISLMHLQDVQGAVTNPIDMGFSVADIRIVGNNKFLAKNPAAKKFFELFTIDLADLSAQYTKMMEGEKSRKDINRHADEWIKNNQKVWDSWLDQARHAAN